MNEESNEDNHSGRDTYVFLDFNGKVYSDILKSQIFVRIANLHEKNPLVQINDNVFKGSYDYSIGTNLFFEEVENVPPSTNAFEKVAPIHLKHSYTTMKVLNLKPVRILSRKIIVPNEVSKIDINLNWDYNELLRKFENGTLHTDAIVTNEPNEGTHGETEVAHEDDESTCEDEFSKDMKDEQQVVITKESEHMEVENEENILNSILPERILESEYEKLKVLAHRPVKRAVSLELIETCDQYLEAYEYHNIERQILQPCDAFQTEPVSDIDENTLSNCVDTDRCILQGIIQPSDQFPRVFSKQEKEKIFTLENFDNLSLAARYYVLKNHVEDLEKYVSTATKETLQTKDEFGRTPLETLQIYKKLCDAVMKRITEIKQLRL